MSFAETLKAFCATHEKTQPELAAILGVCPRTVFAWIHGDAVPNGLKQDAVKMRLAGARARKKK